MNTQLLAVLDASDAVVARFEYAGGRMPVARMQGGALYYLAQDQVGSLRAVYTAAGDAVRTVEYDAWGNILSESAAQDYEGLNVPFGFAGGLHDRDTGLVLFGLRNYDPETGRWASRDPIGLTGGDTDLYACYTCDSVNVVDPETGGRGKKPRHRTLSGRVTRQDNTLDETIALHTKFSPATGGDLRGQCDKGEANRRVAIPCVQRSYWAIVAHHRCSAGETSISFL